MKKDEFAQCEILRKDRAIDYNAFQDQINVFLKKLYKNDAIVLDIKSVIVEGILTVIIFYERSNRDIDKGRIERD